MPLKRNFIKITSILVILLCGVAAPLAAMAEETLAGKEGVPPANSYDMLRYTLAGILVLLLCVIAVLANAVISAGKLYWQHTGQATASKITAVILILLFTGAPHLYAGETPSAAVTSKGLPDDIVVMLIVISLEFVITLVLAKILLNFLSTKAHVPKRTRTINFKLLFQKLNQTVALEEEERLDLQHNYDGIRELDNKIPAWWRFAFYATILFGAVYLYQMFVSETLPDQFQELAAANEIAAIQKEAYLRNAANNIDENNVVMLDASGIAEGQTLFLKNCQACHGDKGQGNVGPNLTDDYWLHKGSLKDVFYSIKYGWQEKGMKSWKEDFSPAQIAQLASFVKSLSGTHPAGGKEPQGTQYIEEAAPVKDTTIAKGS